MEVLAELLERHVRLRLLADVAAEAEGLGHAGVLAGLQERRGGGDEGGMTRKGEEGGGGGGGEQEEEEGEGEKNRTGGMVGEYACRRVVLWCAVDGFTTKRSNRLCRGGAALAGHDARRFCEC